MELLELLLYTTAFSQLSYGHFFDFFLVRIFLKYAYIYKPFENIQTQQDFTTFILTFTHILLHMINFYVYSLSQKCYTYTCGKYIIDNYNYVNKKYLNLRFKVIYYGFLLPFKFIIKKFIFSDVPEQDINNFKKIIELNLSNNNLKKENKLYDTQLKTNKQIDCFLDKILVENSKKNK